LRPPRRRVKLLSFLVFCFSARQRPKLPPSTFAAIAAPLRETLLLTSPPIFYQLYLRYRFRGGLVRVKGIPT
jgi:hypothetical protein